MPPLLIVKLGSTFPAFAESHGDFEDWMQTRLGLPPGQVAVVDARRQPLPEPGTVRGVILTGSHAMVTDREAWSERTAAWIPAVLEARVPLLGICYGHQLIAHALGGEVGPNPCGREVGTVEIACREAASDDPLFHGLPGTIRGQACHAQSVLRLPPGATWLASSRLDPHQAYAIGGTAWGVQFHPEFDVAAVEMYLDRSAGALREQGVDVAQLRNSVAPTPHAEQLLRRFAALADRTKVGGLFIDTAAVRR